MGCLPRNQPLEFYDCPLSDPTVDSADAAQYRHFAADTHNDVLFFCDHSPASQELGMFCYHTKIGDNSAWIRKEKKLRRKISISRKQ